MKKTYISPVAEQLHMIEESMLAASIRTVGGNVEGLGIAGEDTEGLSADVKGNIFSDNLFE